MKPLAVWCHASWNTCGDEFPTLHSGSHIPCPMLPGTIQHHRYGREGLVACKSYHEGTIGHGVVSEDDSNTRIIFFLSTLRNIAVALAHTPPGAGGKVSHPYGYPNQGQVCTKAVLHVLRQSPLWKKRLVATVHTTHWVQRPGPKYNGPPRL